MNERKEETINIPDYNDFEDIEETDIEDDKPTPKMINIAGISILLLFGIFALTISLLWHYSILNFDKDTLGEIILWTGLGVYVLCSFIYIIWKLKELKWKKRHPLRLELSLILNGVSGENEVLFFDDISQINNGFFLHIKPTMSGYINGIALKENETKKLIYHLLDNSLEESSEKENEETPTK